MKKMTAFQNGFMLALTMVGYDKDTPVAIKYQHTLTLKSLERKGLVNILKYRTATDRRHYETVIKIKCNAFAEA